MNQKSILKAMLLSKKQSEKLQNEYYTLSLEAMRLKLLTDEIKQNILNNNQFYSEEKTRRGIKIESIRIINIEDDMDMSDEDFRKYISLTRKGQEEKGILDPRPDYCSALVAESAVRDKKREIYEYTISFLPKDMQDTFNKSWEAPNEILKIFLKLDTK